MLMMRLLLSVVERIGGRIGRGRVVVRIGALGVDVVRGMHLEVD